MCSMTNRNLTHVMSTCDSCQNRHVLKCHKNCESSWLMTSSRGRHWRCFGSLKQLTKILDQLLPLLVIMIMTVTKHLVRIPATVNVIHEKQPAPSVGDSTRLVLISLISKSTIIHRNNKVYSTEWGWQHFGWGYKAGRMRSKEEDKEQEEEEEGCLDKQIHVYIIYIPEPIGWWVTGRGRVPPGHRNQLLTPFKNYTQQDIIFTDSIFRQFQLQL